MVAALFGFLGLPVTIGNATRCSKIPFSVSAPTTINFASNLGLPSSSETSVPMSIITIGTPVTQRASRPLHQLCSRKQRSRIDTLCREEVHILFEDRRQC